MFRKDIGWQHGTPVSSSSNKSKCNYCGKIMRSGGVTRLKQHLTGSSSVVAACKHVPPSVKVEMLQYLSERSISPSRINIEQQSQHPQMVQPPEEEEDPELKFQKDIEEAMKRSKEDPEYKEVEEIEIAMLESQRLNSQISSRASSSRAPQSVVIIEDSDEELNRILGFSDEDEDM